jgi:hypothetical protein
MVKPMSQIETARMATRVVLLGASNLTRCFPIVQCIAKQRLESPVEFVVAMGHGRSYGQETKFFQKNICGIIRSDLWSYLEQSKRMPTYALITDVGNDILYGVSVKTIMQWVAEAIDRLRNCGAQVVLTDLPLGSMRRLGKVRFQLFRTCLFPTCRLSLETVMDRAETLSRALQQMAKDRKMTIIKAKTQWYGLDPIHIRRSRAVSAWNEILGLWPGRTETLDGQISANYLTFYTHAVHQIVSSLGLPLQRADQPFRCLSDGTMYGQF